MISWIKCLQKEVSNLDTLLDKVDSGQVNSSQTIPKLQKVIKFLKEGMLNLIDKSNSLLKFHTEPGSKLIKIREEYLKAMKSLANLSLTINDSTKQPRHNGSTSASRKRSLSKKEISSPIIQSSPSRKQKEKKKEKQEEEEKTGYQDIKIRINQLKLNIKNHKHNDYETKIAVLEEENSEMKKKIEEAKRETRENLENIEILKNKIELLERKKIPENSNNTSSSRKERYLIRAPSDNGEKNLSFVKDDGFINFK